MRFCLPFLLAVQLSAQSTEISGIINRYAAVTALDTCEGIITINDTTGFRAGGVVLLLQMQGAQISANNNSAYGQIQNMRATGRYERAIIDSVSATAIFLKNRLVYAYEPAGRVQVVLVPQYTDVVVADTLRAQPWNGTVGGILALEVTGTLTLNAPLSADGAGFRGGIPYFILDNNCNFAFPETRYYYSLGNWRGSYKGEGVALRVSGRELGRGPQGNGGGGGNDHNSGGGGGAHAAAGGRGGDNDEPGDLGCDGYYPGLGGYALPNTTERLLFGGGGGAGHANNGLTSGGAPGGGIVLVRAGSITGTHPTITANGRSAAVADGDGGGGGGAGGTIWLQVTTTDSNLVVQANGGNGGNTYNSNSDRCFGPGGGGSGGRILTNFPAVSPPNGGGPGRITLSTNGCNESSNGATSGASGLVQPAGTLPEGQLAFTVPMITMAPQPATVCTGAAAVFVVGTNTEMWTYQWQIQTSNGGSWQDLATGPNYNGVNTDSLRINNAALLQNGFRYRVVVRILNCAQIISPEALLTVITAPTAAFTTTINDRTVFFTNQSTNATSYSWYFGNGGTAQIVDPQFTYAQDGSYTVTLLAINACDTVETSQIVAVPSSPTANFVVPDSIQGCVSAMLNFQDLTGGASTTREWTFPGGNPASSTAENVSVTYTTSGIYTGQLIASNLNGQDTLVRTFYVEVTGFASADFDYLPAPGGVVVFSNEDQPGTIYSWDVGDGSPLIMGVNPVHQYIQAGTYLVTLSASNACGVSILQQNIIVTVEGVGTAAVQHLGRVRLFPNPVGEQCTIDCSATNALPLEIQLVDAAGRVLLVQRTGLLPVTNLSLAGWPKGIYTLILRFAQGRVVRGVVKE